jgi:mono/diheme cytochrome c family protein
MRLAVLALALMATPVCAGDIWSGVFTAEQAARGKDVYLTHCAAACHIENLSGNGPSPGLAGDDFMLRWEDFSIAELMERIRTTMPKVAPASLSAEDYLAVTIYILAANGARAGQTELSAAAADKVMITGKK